MKNIALKLGLPETATEEEILAAIAALMADKASEGEAKAAAQTMAANEKARADAAETDKTRLTEAAKAATTLAANERTARVDSMLTLAMNEGRISKAELDIQRLAFGADFKAAETALNQRKPALDMKGVTVDRTQQQGAVLAENERQDKINAWVNEAMSKRKLTYIDAFRAAQAAPELAGVFAAMAPQA